jgi:hypothetical protein
MVIRADPGLVLFPSLRVRLRELRRLVESGADPRAIREQTQALRREHRRRLRQALRGLHDLKPLCAPELRPLWVDTIDSAILLLHLNARDFHGAIDGVAMRPARAPRGG